MAVSKAIDVRQQGLDRVICAYELEGGVIVDPGPASRVETLLEELSEEPRVLLLTHIHLDHAGATGVLVRRFPELQVHVHERGAPHLVDPSKLVASASKLYGDRMGELWGEVAPVPEENVHALSGGETVEGCRVEYTPGHAWHHVSYLHEDSGDAYVGDVCGVRIPPATYTSPPTPPPDIDLEAWERSLDLVAGWEPAAFCLTHFGRHEDTEDQVERTRRELRRYGEWAREGDSDAFVTRVEEAIREEAGPEAADRYHSAAQYDQLYKGLERYWRKRREREEAEAA